MADIVEKKFSVTDGGREDIPQCAAIACHSEIGRRYGFRVADIEEKMAASIDRTSLLLVARALCDEGTTAAASTVAGFAWIEPRGAFGQAPYLKLIAVDEKSRSSGVGALLLAEFERRTISTGTAWLLLVSDFNRRAVSFYERHGYAQAGRLPSFAKEDIDEIIMYKRHW
jgi:ribosomal protein S18 acetylase RimI-like enzyme